MLEEIEMNNSVWTWKFCIPDEFGSTEELVLQYKHDCLFDAFVKYRAEVGTVKLTVSRGVKKLVCHGTCIIPEDALLCPDCATRCVKPVIEPLQDKQVLSRLGVYCCTDSVIREPKQYRLKCDKCGCEWLWHQYDPDTYNTLDESSTKEMTKGCCDGSCGCGCGCGNHK